jgi:hypothetical protein
MFGHPTSIPSPPSRSSRGNVGNAAIHDRLKPLPLRGTARDEIGPLNGMLPATHEGVDRKPPACNDKRL